MKKISTLLVLTLLFAACEFDEDKSSDKSDTKEQDQVTSAYPGSIEKDDPLLESWASSVINYIPGEEVDAKWQDASNALGKAEGTSYDIVSLGRGGEITLGFEKALSNQEGHDFAIFENSFSEQFLELAFVEVSSDGSNYVRFNTYSYTESAVSQYGTLNFTDLYDEATAYTGFAGVHKQGYGTLFDLDDLVDSKEYDESLIDLNNIKYIKLIDIVGDGSQIDSAGNPIYDPYPCEESAGFDLDAIGVLSL